MSGLVLSEPRESGVAPAVTWLDVEDSTGVRLGAVTRVDGRWVAVCGWPCLVRIPAPAGVDAEGAALLLQAHLRCHGGGRS